MQNSKPAFYAIIPATVRYHKEVPPLGRLLYGEITALCNQRGYCFATNQYFADLYEVSIRTIQKSIKSLVDPGFIRVEVDRSAPKGADRRIYIVDVPAFDLDRHEKKFTPGVKKSSPVIVQDNNDSAKAETPDAHAHADKDLFGEDATPPELYKKIRGGNYQIFVPGLVQSMWSLYKRFMKARDQVAKDKEVAEGANMKRLAVVFIDMVRAKNPELDRDGIKTEVEHVFEFVLANWDKLPERHRGWLLVRQIYANINLIIETLRHANRTNTTSKKSNLWARTGEGEKMVAYLDL